jgi:hypothetical protein
MGVAASAYFWLDAALPALQPGPPRSIAARVLATVLAALTLAAAGVAGVALRRFALRLRLGRQARRAI